MGWWGSSPTAQPRQWRGGGDRCGRAFPPRVQALAAALPGRVPISIDTTKAQAAEAALDAGASLVNDTSGLCHDAAMAPLIAAWRVPVVIMSNVRGQVRRDPMGDVARQLAGGLEIALAAGIPWEDVILDPGIGFGLTAEENLAVLRRLRELRVFGRPLLVGTSRKSTIGKVLGGLPPEDRLEGTAATVGLSIAHCADIVRGHDVGAMVRVARMADAIVRGWAPWRTVRGPTGSTVSAQRTARARCSP